MSSVCLDADLGLFLCSAARIQDEFRDDTVDERTRKPLYPNVVAIKKVTNVFSKKILAKRALREIKLLEHFRGIRNVSLVTDILAFIQLADNNRRSPVSMAWTFPVPTTSTRFISMRVRVVPCSRSHISINIPQNSWSATWRPSSGPASR